MEKIRNFCIIAHIDHGKSTLADRLLEITETVEKREMKQQLLDQMDLEREKGITIKLQPVRMNYRDHQLNLIDTPGHADFGYEVSRSLAACEGALLVVDATQGVQAQTLATVYQAVAADLTIIPVINKIDLPAADTVRVSKEVVKLLGCDESEIIQVSAKTGENIESLLTAVINQVPPPSGSADSPLRALVFDSYFDEYRGVVLNVRIIDGQLSSKEEIVMHATQAAGKVNELGFLTPKPNKTKQLNTGEIGYIVTDYKSVAEAKVGDTVTNKSNSSVEALEGYEEASSFVYAGIYPASTDDHGRLKDALEKLALNDASLRYEPESSTVLGIGYRCGFLGLLHMDIVKERLERNYNLEVIVTNPSTHYQLKLVNGETKTLKSPAQMPDPSSIEFIEEPWIKGEILCPKDNVGGVVQLIVGSRGLQDSIDYLDDQVSIVNFSAPLATIITDFHDRLKSITSGFGSMSYELAGYQQQDLVRLDFLVGGEIVPSLSLIVHKTEQESVGREVVSKLKKLVPKQLFKVSLQAAVGGKIIARDDVSALKKNVTGHLYGGDVSRKKKLWAKQKRGKKRLKKFGNVEIPPEVFTVMLKRDE